MGQDGLDIGAARTAAALRMQLAQMTVASQMLERCANDEKSRRYLAALDQSICRMLRIVGRMELTARLSGEPVLDLAPVDLGELVAEVGGRMAGLLRHAGVELSIQGPEHLPARVDEVLIRQILLELTANAAKAGERVTLALARDGDQAVFTVTDDGPGLPPEGLARLFQGDEDDVPDWRRQGNGIAIARRAAQLHGGRLMAYRVQSGGLRVAASIPLGAEEAAGLSSPGLRWDPGGFSEEVVALSELLPASAFLPDGDWGD